MEIKLKLTQEAASALNHCMTNTDAKGRMENRKHAKIMRAFKAGCTDREETTFNGVKQEITRFKGGDMVLPDEDTFKFLKDSVEQKIRVSIPGSYTDGYEGLSETIDTVSDELKKEELKKSDNK